MGARGTGGIVFKWSDKNLQKCYEAKGETKQSDQDYFYTTSKNIYSIVCLYHNTCQRAFV